jgi:hypothetical protein
MALRNWKRSAIALAAGLLAGGLQAQDVEQWCRWENTRQTLNDYQTNDNPYRKLTLDVTFTPRAGTCSGSSWCSSFTVPGFWDGGKVFKIRGTFPVGTWDWSTTCSGISNGVNCASDPALNGATGTIVVGNGPGQCDPAQTGTFDLLEKGLPLPTTNTTLLKSLTYGDGVTPYHWRADTTWAGPITEIKDPANTVNGVFTPTKWKQFLDDRVTKGFNTVLIGVAPSSDSATDGTDLLFESIGTPCTGATYPKSCSRWRPLKYWRQLDEIVKLANDRGILVVIAGVMDPQGNASNSSPIYPDAADAEIFARNLAGRMAGSHVLFSPSLDDPLNLSSTLLDTVGAKLRATAPRNLITAHLAGQSDICDYATVHGKSWHQIHLFQSGHAVSASAACPGLGLSSFGCAVYRARTMPDLLAPNPTSPPACIPSGGLTPIKPIGNAEAAYDTVDAPTTQTVDSAYGVRNTGYSSALNGAFGVTLGVDGIVLWNNPNSRLTSPAADDMKILGELFDLSPWQMLQRRTARIKNQPTLAADEYKKMIMAATLDSKFAMIYMPDDADVQFDGSFLTGFDCDPTSVNYGTWTITWVDPKTKSTSSQGACTNIAVNGATRKITRPACTGNGSLGECDWVVQLRKVGSYGASAIASESLAVWAEPVEQGWSIEARTADGKTFAVSEPTVYGRIAKQPVTAAQADGVHFVVWESQTGDDQHDVLLRRVDGKGRLLDHEYTVNVTREHDQTSPWIATNPAAKGGVVAWASYAQDGDLDGVYARLINPAGVPYGPEIQVNEVTAGRQDFHEAVMFPDGSFAVAWTSDGQDGDAEGVYVRRFDSRGRPLGGEVRVNETTAGAQWLSALEPLAGGGFLVRWTGYAPDGEDLGLFARLYDADGNPIGGEQAGSGSR